jgi:hypothetical protein
VEMWITCSLNPASHGPYRPECDRSDFIQF